MAYIGARTAELRGASAAVRGATTAVHADSLPPTGGGATELGSAELAGALDEFLQGWRVGIANLVGDGEELALSLDQMADVLIAINAGAEASE